MASATSGTAKVTLPAADQILIEREFAAPAHLVWRAVTEPELVRRWWHAGRGEMTACEIDLRVGGTWRYAMRPARAARSSPSTASSSSSSRTRRSSRPRPSRRSPTTRRRTR